MPKPWFSGVGIPSLLSLIPESHESLRSVMAFVSIVPSSCPSASLPCLSPPPTLNTRAVQCPLTLEAAQVAHVIP